MTGTGESLAVVHPHEAQPESARLAVQRALDRADRPDASHVFAVRFDDQAQAAAEEIDRLRAGGVGPLQAATPITIKHNIDIIGNVTSAGSPALAKVTRASADAEVVRRLRIAGYIILGHSNMTELAFSGLGLNPHFGTPRNPAFDIGAHIPGGSSAGAAVSVALDIVPVAIGTDTGGSVRIPAAMCGVVGFKPTASAISQVGVVPLSPTLDAVGIIGRDTAQCATVFDVVRNHPGQSGVPLRDLRGLRLGALQGYVLCDMDAVVARTYDEALAHLSKMGADIVDCSFPKLDELPHINRNGSFAAVESFSRYGALIASLGDLMDPAVVRRIAAGEAISPSAYAELLSERQRLIALGTRLAKEYDALLMPTIPIVAPTFDDVADADDYHRINLLVLRNPTVVNMMDGCAISLPCQTPGTPPVGLTLVQARGRDNNLLRVAAAIERVLSEYRRYPRTLSS